MRSFVRLIGLSASLLLVACGGDEPTTPAASTAAPAATTDAPAATASSGLLVAEMRALGDASVSGVVVLRQGEDGLILGAALDGVSAGEHAIHVHETGDCSASDGSSAGGHFSPNSRPHGGPDSPVTERHAGDFGNFTTSAAGQGKFSMTRASDVALDAFAGRAIIVHAGADDFTSQPSGAAGDRIACGVLESRPL